MSLPVAGPAKSGCLLFLLQLTESMQQDVAWGDKSQSKIRLARWLVDLIIQDIVGLYERGRLPCPDLELSIVGYRNVAGAISFISLLPGTTNTQPWISLPSLIQEIVESRPSGPCRWVNVEAARTCSGRGAACKALEYGYELIKRWLYRHTNVSSVVIVHCGDQEICEDTSYVRRSLELLSADQRKVITFSCLFTEQFEGKWRPSSRSPDALQSPWRELWSGSSLLSDGEGANSGLEQRAFSINVWPRQEIAELVKGTRVGSPEVVMPEPQREAARPQCHVHRLWLQKGGNTEKEYEDASAISSEKHVIAISDGAGEGIFVRAWAEILTESFVAAPVDLDDADAFSQWLQGCRQAWWERINYRELRWSQKDKVDDTGGAATFLGFRLNGPASVGSDARSLRWRAWAVGDSCLFWTRANQLLAAFPIISTQGFGLAPSLLRTKTGHTVPSPLAAQGDCRSGDCFFLATDAVAQGLLAAVEKNGGLDWNRYASLEESAWHTEIEQLRSTGGIVNDDCTLLAIRVD